MRTYWIAKAKDGRSWQITMTQDGNPGYVAATFIGKGFKTRKEAVSTARLLAGWRGRVEVL